MRAASSVRSSTTTRQPGPLILGNTNGVLRLEWHPGIRAGHPVRPDDVQLQGSGFLIGERAACRHGESV
jgi:hypothetical protein